MEQDASPLSLTGHDYYGLAVHTAHRARRILVIGLPLALAAAVALSLYAL